MYLSHYPLPQYYLQCSRIKVIINYVTCQAMSVHEMSIDYRQSQRNQYIARCIYIMIMRKSLKLKASICERFHYITVNILNYILNSIHEVKYITINADLLL